MNAMRQVLKLRAGPILLRLGDREQMKRNNFGRRNLLQGCYCIWFGKWLHLLDLCRVRGRELWHALTNNLLLRS